MPFPHRSAVLPLLLLIPCLHWVGCFHVPPAAEIKRSSYVRYDLRREAWILYKQERMDIATHLTCPGEGQVRSNTIVLTPNRKSKRSSELKEQGQALWIGVHRNVSNGLFGVTQEVRPAAQTRYNKAPTESMAPPDPCGSFDLPDYGALHLLKETFDDWLTENDRAYGIGVSTREHAENNLIIDRVIRDVQRWLNKPSTGTKGNHRQDGGTATGNQSTPPKNRYDIVPHHPVSALIQRVSTYGQIICSAGRLDLDEETNIQPYSGVVITTADCIPKKKSVLYVTHGPIGTQKLLEVAFVVVHRGHKPTLQLGPHTNLAFLFLRDPESSPQPPPSSNRALPQETLPQETLDWPVFPMDPTATFAGAGYGMPGAGYPTSWNVDKLATIENGQLQAFTPSFELQDSDQGSPIYDTFGTFHGILTTETGITRLKDEPSFQRHYVLPLRMHHLMLNCAIDLATQNPPASGRFRIDRSTCPALLDPEDHNYDAMGTRQFRLGAWTVYLSPWQPGACRTAYPGPEPLETNPTSPKPNLGHIWTRHIYAELPRKDGKPARQQRLRIDARNHWFTPENQRSRPAGEVDWEVSTKTVAVAFPPGTELGARMPCPETFAACPKDLPDEPNCTCHHDRTYNAGIKALEYIIPGAIQSRPVGHSNLAYAIESPR